MFGLCWGDVRVAAGVRVFAEPKTRPPPSVLRDMVNSDYGSMGSEGREKRKVGGVADVVYKSRRRK